MTDSTNASRQNWGSYIGFVFAVIRSALDIGNIWRFLYILVVNGGKTFLITYLIIIFTFGLSLIARIRVPSFRSTPPPTIIQ